MRLRWKELLLAFIMAGALWFGMSGTEIVESQVEVRLDYKGIPSDLVVRGDGLINKISVRVRGPVGQIRAMSMRDYVYAMDLSSLTKGENILPIAGSHLGVFGGGLHVIDVTPTQIRLEVDTLMTKELPLKASVLGSIPGGHVLETRFEPETVVVRGPSQDLEKMKEVEVPLQMGEVQGAVERDFRVQPVLPPGMDITPSRVMAFVNVDLKRKSVRVERSVHLEAPESVKGFIRPSKVRIDVDLPEDLVADAAGNKQIGASVTVPDPQVGAQTLPVKVTLPDGARLKQVEPAEVTVTLEQKN